MTVYAWPDSFRLNHFEMRLVPNTRVFVSPYSQDTQTVDLGAARWAIVASMVPTTKPLLAAAREAFFDRLGGTLHRIAMGHQRLKVPQGTLRGGGIAAVWKNASNVTANWVGATWVGGDPIVAAAVAQGANTATIRHTAGRTLEAGDPLGLGGQLVRVMAPVVFDAAGQAVVEFAPRARQAIPAFSAVEWSAPTAQFILKPGADNVGTAWGPRAADGASFELIEVFP